MTTMADFELITTDENGEQSSQCIKSYSFSNYIVSEESKDSDIYSREETKTKKIYLGQPVYRMVLHIPGTATSKVSIDTGYDFSFADKVILIHDLVVDKGEFTYNSNYNQFWINKYTKKLFYYHNSSSGHNGIEVVVEYTKSKSTESLVNGANQLYLHYITSKEKIMKSTPVSEGGFIIKPAYTYNEIDDSCVKK